MNFISTIFSFFRKKVFDDDTIREAVELYCTNKDEAITKYGEISTWDTSNVTNMKKSIPKSNKLQ